MKLTIIVLLTCFPLLVCGQDNCLVFKMNGDSCRFQACDYLEKAPRYFQLTRAYHEVKDSALALCPEYGVIYKTKSTAYLKTGDFINWKKYIDKAVELNPTAHLDYRAWCRFQFFRDYQGAINDLEELERLKKYDIGWCQNGHYHLSIAKALCYKMIGKQERAIEIINSQLNKDSSSAGLYTFHHLGVLYLETKQYEKAILSFEQQSDIYDLAESKYFLALTFDRLGEKDKVRKTLVQASELYESSQNMFDSYTHHVDKVFLSDIEKLLNER